MGDVKAFVTKWCAGHDSGTLGPKIRADLESLLAAERAAATAAAVGACLQEVHLRRQMYEGDRERALDATNKSIAGIRLGVASVIEGEIRALSPEGWCAVKREDLVFALEGLVMSGMGPLHPVLDRIRAALDAAKEG